MANNDGYLECDIINKYSEIEHEDMTVYVHLMNGELCVFHKVPTDPIFWKGWLSIEHIWVGDKKITSIIRESDVKYLSYYATAKEVSE
jgi:hypothetical protein